MAQVLSPGRRAALPGAVSPGRVGPAATDPASPAQQQPQPGHGPPAGYNYSPLAYVFGGAAVGEALHTYGVVVFASEPRPSRGTDYYMHMMLADASWGADRDAPSRQPVRVNFFARDPAALPRPARPAGDIIRLHRARVSTWGAGDARNLVARLGPGGGGWPTSPSAFVLFDGAAAGQIDPYQLSHQTYSWDNEVEPMLLDLLREVAAPYIAPGGARPAPASRHDTTLALFAQTVAFGPPHTADLPAVRVLAVDGGAGVFWVWDGTDARPWPPGAAALGVRVRPAGEVGDGRDGAAAAAAPRSPARRATAARLAGRLEACALLEGEALSVDLFARLADRPLPPPPPGPAGHPPIGTALPVSLLLTAGAPRPPLPTPGAWIRLDKLGGAVVGGRAQALFLESSLWSRAPPGEVGRVEAAAAERLAAGHTAAHAPADPARLAAAPAPGGPAAAAPRGTLRQAVGHAAGPRGSSGSGRGGGRGGGGGGAAPPSSSSAAPTAGLRVLARIIAVHPPPAQAAAACVRGPGGVWEFAVTLELEDATGRATALAGGPDGGGLFAGLEPRDLGAAPSAAAALRRRLAALAPEEGGGGGGGGVWADLGLTSGAGAAPPAGARKRPAPGAAPPSPGLRVFGTAATAVGGPAAAARPAGRGRRGG